MKVFLLSMMFLFGCSSSNNLNQVSDGTNVLKGGQADGKSWDDKLVFKRHSWFKGAFMKYDLFLAKLDKKSPFYNWIGESQKSEINKCSNFYVALMYAGMSLVSPSSLSDLKESFSIVGIKSFSLPKFTAHLKNHYFFLQWNLKNYRLTGYCKEVNIKDIEIQIPNFSTVRVLY